MLISVFGLTGLSSICRDAEDIFQSFSNFPAVEHHRPLASPNLYYFRTEAHVREQFS